MRIQLKDQIKKKLRHFWHELFERFAPPALDEFSMNCKHVVEQIDAVDANATWVQWFRLQLHLSLCEACSYYLKATRALRRLVSEMSQASFQGHGGLEQLNKDLLVKYARGPRTK